MFHNTVCWPSCRSADQTDLGRSGLAVDQLARPILDVPQAFRPHLAGLAAQQVCVEKTLRPFDEKGLRPPAGTPRRTISVFAQQDQQHLASGLKSPRTIRGSGRPPPRPPAWPRCSSVFKTWHGRPSRGLQLGPDACPSCALDMISQTSRADLTCWALSSGEFAFFCM